MASYGTAGADTSEAGRNQEYEQVTAADGSAGAQGGQALRVVISGRPMFAGADVYLAEGEELICDGGAISWIDGDMDISTGMSGGCLRAYARTCSGESCCMNTVKVKEGMGMARVGLNMPLPGDMMTFVATPEAGWMISQGAFIAGTPNCQISARFTGCGACCFSDEGTFMTKVTTKDDDPAYFVAGGFGGIKRVDIPAGESLFIDNGMIFALHSETKLRVAMVGGLKQTCCSGEGLVTRIEGPATAYCQSRDPSLFKSLNPVKPGDNGNAQ